MRCRSSRIVNVSSSAQLFGDINFSDPNFQEGRYQPWVAYGQSKLANAMFSLELSNRLPLAANITSNSLHPGVVRTELARCDHRHTSPSTLHSTIATSIPDKASSSRTATSGVCHGYFCQGCVQHYQPSGVPKQHKTLGRLNICDESGRVISSVVGPGPMFAAAQHLVLIRYLRHVLHRDQSGHFVLAACFCNEHILHPQPVPYSAMRVCSLHGA